MNSKLDILLESISLERVVEETYNRANEAIGSFNFGRAKIETWEEFKCCMAGFRKHLDEKMLKLKKPLDVQLTEYWKYCIGPLLKVYGNNGDVTAFTIANTGNEGGLYAVLKAFAMYKAEEYTKNEISGRVYSYWQGLSAAEKVEAAGEYLSKYRHIIPSELFESGSPTLIDNFWQVLEKHPFVVQTLHKAGR
ncbi:MAG: hypothetical protein ABIG61_07770 [Planctomycetota bacterium]